MEKLINLSDVNTNTKEGRYLMAALAKITTESHNSSKPNVSCCTGNKNFKLSK